MIYNIFINLKKINIQFVFIALIHLTLSFYTDKFIFFIPEIIVKQALYERYIIFKIIFFVILLIIWYVIYYIIKEYKTNENMRRWLKYSVIYFIIMMIFLLLTWPGVWRCDELNIFKFSRSLSIDYWQGFLISKIYILFLMLLPFPSGIIIIQNLIIALIVGYTVFKVQIFFKLGKVQYLMFIPFLLLPVIDNNLYPMRCTLYAYMWLFLAVEVIFTDSNKKPEYSYIFIIFCVSLIIYLFRTEGLLCLIFIPAIIYFYLYKVTDKIQKILFVILYLLCFVSVFFVQKEMGHNNRIYIIYTMVSTMPDLYSKLDSVKQKEICDIMGRIIRIDGFTENGIDLQHKNIIKKFKKKEFKEFVKLYFRLIFDYPYLYYKGCLKKFILSNQNIWTTTKLFDKYSQYQEEEIVLLKSFQPINKNVRKK